MLRSAALVLTLLPAAAPALTAEEMAGLWESLAEGGNSCAANPARLSVTRSPDRLTFSWPEPMTVFDGSTRTEVTYDLVAEDAGALVLRLQGETRLTAAGETVVWLLRPDAARGSFCWGRTDWPALRCDHVYRRCPEPGPTS